MVDKILDKKQYIPDKGDIVWINLNPTKGHEQRGRRPAFVVSPKIYNEKAGLALLCPISSKIKNYPFEVEVKGGQIEGVIIADQIRSLDWSARNVEKIEMASVVVVEEVKARILAIIS